MEMTITKTTRKTTAASTSISKLAVQEELQMQMAVLQRDCWIPLLNMQPENQKVTWSGHEIGQESDGHQANYATLEVMTTSYPST